MMNMKMIIIILMILLLLINFRRKNDDVMLRWSKMRSQINHFKEFILDKWRRKMANSRRCDICNVDVKRASYVKHLTSKTVLEKEEQNELITTGRLYKVLLKLKIKKSIFLNPSDREQEKLLK